MFTKTCYKVLESQTAAKDEGVLRVIHEVLGAVVQSYNQTFNVTTSILHLLSHFEHLSGPLAAMVDGLVAKYDGQSVVNELMREVGRNDPKEYAQDAGGTRNLALFLTELGDRIPGSIVRSNGIAVLLPHLDGESYTMRNSILSILTSIVCEIVATSDASDSAKKMRTQFQDILEDRVHDVSAYVRAKVMQLWAKMAMVEVSVADADEEQEEEERQTRFTSAIPRTRLPVLVALAAQRLKDKSAIARKDAMRLVTVLLTRNPYGPQIKLSVWKKDYETNLDALTELRKKHGFVDESKVDAAADLLDEAEEGKKKNKDEEEQSEVEDEAKEEAEVEEEEEELKPEEEPGDERVKPQELIMQELKVTFYKDATFFAQQMEEVIPNASDLLGSSSSSDMKESIMFLEACQRFGMEGAAAGIRKMLALIWSKEDSIRGALMSAYQRLYLEHGRPEIVAKNLVQLTEGCNLGELTSLEELINELKKTNAISNSVIKTLWSMFAMKGNATREQSVRALIILGMVARADPSIVKSHSGQLIGIGLGERGQVDMELVRHTCKALQVLVPAATRFSKETAQLFESTDTIFEKMVDIITTDSSEMLDGWTSAAEEVINTFYSLSENPDRLCEGLVCKLSDQVFRTDGVAPTVGHLTRLVSVVGHVALKQLVHLEKIEGELKRRNRVSEDREQKKKREKNSDDDIIGGAAAVDDIADDIAHISENTLVVGNNLLAKFSPLIVAICTKPGKFNDIGLRTAAVLALSKFMCASAQFAEEQLQVMFTILQDAPEPVIRANCILAVGDLSFRFANLLEPWTSHIYARLQDDNVMVRKNAVMVLTHLILNDMIKIKGQISEMAKRLEDPDERVACLTKLFFQELARKGNAIYNMLPDVISQLATADSGLQPGQFQKITGYLFGFITKGVHTVSLVEKLCYRFRTTTDVTQWRYFAHCLSLLQYNDKAVKKLQSQISCFQDTLFDAEIHECFVGIIAKAKKFASADMKDAVAEFEDRITEIHEKGAEDDAVAQKAGKASKRVAKTKGKPGRTGGKRGEAAMSDSEPETLPESSGEGEAEPTADENANPNEAAIPDHSKSAKKKAAAARKKGLSVANAGGAKAASRSRAKPKRAAIVDSEDDADDDCMI